MSYIADYTNSYDIRGQQITITASARFDKNTGKVIADLELDDHAAKLALEKYRRKFGIISPTDLKIYDIIGILVKKNLLKFWDGMWQQ